MNFRYQTFLYLLNQVASWVIKRNTNILFTAQKLWLGSIVCQPVLGGIGIGIVRQWWSIDVNVPCAWIARIHQQCPYVLDRRCAGVIWFHQLKWLEFKMHNELWFNNSPFLDIKSKLDSNGNIDMSLYRKETARNIILHATIAHSKKLKDSIQERQIQEILRSFKKADKVRLRLKERGL